MSKPNRQKEMNEKIHKNTLVSFKLNKDMCKFHNWLGRMFAFAKTNKKVWPLPSRFEVEKFNRYDKKYSYS